MEITGFFSYAHADDAYEFLTHLKEDLCNEFKMISGSNLDLFIDRESILWGDTWRNSISSGINDASFFIPILSPNYFHSGPCKAELTQYMDKAKELGVKELLLPLLFVDIKPDELGLDRTLVSSVLEYQYLDIQNLRFLDRGSGRYVRVVHDIAQRLWDANIRITSKVEAESRSASGETDFNQEEQSGGDNGSEGEADGFILESVADFKPTLDEMAQSTEQINIDITSIGACVSDTNDKMQQKQNAGQFTPNVALALTGSLAQELAPIALDYADHSDQFLASVNKTERVLTPLVKYWLESGTGDDELKSLRDMIASTEEARVKVQSFKDSIKPAKRISRSLLKTMTSIESSTSVCLAAMDVVIGWKGLLSD